ncbi:BatD family protein, partial [Candidatus Babeliales bacterium]|nr:BatD family protein [Candidatus Babeliales bacterium]
KKALSNNLQINVLPLPEYGGVVDGVGDFKQFKAYVDKNEVFVNEPILFNLQIEGKGNLDQIVAPKLKLPNSFRSYESKTDVEQDLVIDYLGGKKKFEYVLQIPQKGEYQIPAQAFTYFDTQSKRYKTLKTSSLKLNIKESEQIREQANNKVEIKEQDNSNKNNLESKQDINFIEENIQDFSENQKSFFLKIFANLNSLKFPGIIFLILLLLPVLFSFKKYLKPVKKVANKLFLNKFKKTKTSSKLLKKLEEIIEKKQKEKLYQFFLNYLSFKFDIQENTMNQDLIQEMLLKINWNHDKINKFLNYLNECAGVSFAAKLKTGHATIENEKLLNASKYWFFYLESENNRG